MTGGSIAALFLAIFFITNTQFSEKSSIEIYGNNSNNFYLSPDPIEFIQNSNIITINYPNHDFVIGDNIIIQNVTGIIKILHNALYLVNNLKYVILNIENNEISINYTNYIDKLYIRIELI